MSLGEARSQESEVRREEREFVARGKAAQAKADEIIAEERARSRVLNLVTSELLPLCHYEGVSLDAAGQVAAQIVDSLFRNFRVTER